MNYEQGEKTLKFVKQIIVVFGCLTNKISIKRFKKLY
jgi:hypothetical protein